MDVSRHNVVFCDSLEALAAARDNGLSSAARILSSSPAVLKAVPAAEDIDARLPHATVDGFIRSVGPFTADLFAILQASADFRGTAISGAYGGFIGHMLLHKALMVTVEDLSEPRLVLQPVTGNRKVDSNLRSPWPDFLKANPELDVMDFQVRLPLHGTSFGGRPPALSWHLKNLRFSRVAYRALTAIGPRLPARWLKKADILVARDSNELVKDTAVSLGFRGHRLIPLRLLLDRKNPLTERQRDSLKAAIRTAFDRHYRDYFLPVLHDDLVEKLTVLSQDYIETSSGIQAHAIDRLAGYRSNGRGPEALILHGAPMTAGGAGLRAAAQTLGIPVFGFQHGVRREIANWTIDAGVLNENNYCDAMLAFNEVAARVSVDANPFSSSPVFPVGMPSDYWRLSKLSMPPAPQPLLYVSTLLYRGIRQISTTSLTDLERGEREMGIIQNVLSALPHRVLYKPYPSLRYADTDPALAMAERAANIDVFLDEFDLRFMVRRHRVVITGGATSTVGWCALSDRPLVFIDDPAAQPLKPEAKAQFEAAFFLFDASASDFHARLAAFLSQPLEDIEAAARQKSAARKTVLRDLFGAAPHPGRAAREAIAAFLRSSFEDGRQTHG